MGDATDSASMRAGLRNVFPAGLGPGPGLRSWRWLPVLCCAVTQNSEFMRSIRNIIASFLGAVRCRGAVTGDKDVTWRARKTWGGEGCLCVCAELAPCDVFVVLRVVLQILVILPHGLC
ncbi:hypothetical protein BDW22DRAFT_65597 [Trametopsis cervina]|nr:hypothetical protein BDW22DRAFT_65597 [Trametopsis cervina]